MKLISNEVIAKFLEGHNDLKHVISIETTYNDNVANLIINDPDKGKVVESRTYKSFAWITEKLGQAIFRLPSGKTNSDAIKRRDELGIKIKVLKTANQYGIVPHRMDKGYKFQLIGDCSTSQLRRFVESSGIKLSDEEWRSEYLAPSPTEQFMIQTGIRLFKGYEEYNDLNRMQFDIETEGLDPKTCKITQIGIRTNKGFEHIISVTGNTPRELRESEKLAIQTTGQIFRAIAPDILSGYNSEDFDFSFFEVRCGILGISFNETFIGLNDSNAIRKDSTLKLGSDSIHYKQTYLWGLNVIDVSHAVRKTMAINSELKGWGLKYITKYSKVEKKNRVYVEGSIISKTWKDENKNYLFNDTDGDWFKINENTDIDKYLANGYVYQTGRYIVERYLIDDLWETDKVDENFNQASFLLSKIIPTGYMRSSTMGTAGIWQLIMMAWSFENDLAVPMGQPQKTFTGGLSRLLEVGYATNVVKLDYSALYPNIEITWDVFPDHDISGVMKGLLTYIAETRDIYKGLKGEYGAKAKVIGELIDSGTLSETELEKNKELLKEYKHLEDMYDNKQLPIKILANSFFGSFGAPHIFRWGDIDCAEETTCRGRQSLRLMVEHFYHKYKFRPLVCDSVTYDTPVYLKCKETGLLSIVQIKDLFNENEDLLAVGYQDRDLSEKPYYVLTVNGWKDISYVYRHKTEKDIYQIITHGNNIVNVTSDHSVFQNGIQKKPTELNIGDTIDIFSEYNFNYDLYNRNDHYELEYIDEAFDNGLIFRDDESFDISKVINYTFKDKISFIDGLTNFKNTNKLKFNNQLRCEFICHLLRVIGIYYDITYNNNEYELTFNVGTKHIKDRSNIIKSISKIENNSEYVYDISTGDGTFVGGIGMIELKNTDGMNFAMPDDINNIKYVSQGKHRFTEKTKGQELSGLSAVLAEFNDLYMEGRMGLDLDDVCKSTINFSRKNYANLIIGKDGKEKIKLVGNTIKSNKMPKYIEEFLSVGIKYLLDGNGYDFIELYYKTVDNIVNYNVPLSKIASKSRVRSTIKDYEEKCKTLNKAGNPMPRQAHMELAIKHNLNVNIGDTIYYINTGSSAKDGDIKTIKNKETNKIEEIQLNCVLLPIEDVENNPETTTDEYNRYKYLEMFNKRLARILVCFKPEIRDKVIINFVKSDYYEEVNGKKVYDMILEERSFFTKEDCELCAGIPLDPIDQDDVETELMLLESREVEFWKRVNKTPNYMTQSFWDKFIIDYELEKIEIEKYDRFKEREMLMHELFNITVEDINILTNDLITPEWFSKKYRLSNVYDENANVVDMQVTLNKNGVQLCSIFKIMYYKQNATEFEEWKSKYKTKRTLNAWLKHKGSKIDYNVYYKELFGLDLEYEKNNIHYTPRVYKDYDALEKEANTI